MCHAKQTVIGVMGGKGLTPNESNYVTFDHMSLCEILYLWNHHCGIVTTNTRCVASSPVGVFVGLHSCDACGLIFEISRDLIRIWCATGLVS